MTSAMLAMTEEYEEQPLPIVPPAARPAWKPRQPTDAVAAEHVKVHELLERWGRWLSEGYSPSTCASLEKGYFKGGSEATPPSTAAAAPDPRVVAFDHVMRLMRQRVPQHFECLRLYYVERMRPWDANKGIPSICRTLAIHWRDFDWYIGHCRSMARNIAHELGVL